MHILAALSVLLLSTHAAAAQYCASYYDGTKSCGIPSLQACERSVRGVGGVCVADDTAQLGPPIKGPLQRMFDRAAEQDAEYQKPSSPDLDDVPPPPQN